MFDIAFSEMVVIAVVALIVIGPERLPKVARTVGNLVGRLQRYVSDVKADINREMELEELGKFRDQFQSAVQSVDQTIRSEVAGADTSSVPSSALNDKPPSSISSPKADAEDLQAPGQRGRDLSNTN